VQLSGEAIGAARRLIERDFGSAYVPGSPRQYKTVAKNAQEAHEAIRPTDLFRRPQDVARFLDHDQQRLYELIWKRTVASQMESAVLDQVAVDIHGAAGRAAFRATGSVVQFDGFLKLYQEGRDDAEDEDGRRLPPLKDRDGLNRLDVRPEQHFTEPPPRYSEASLVKRLEELGIGRPSTYASIIQVLLDRSYVRLDKKRFVPEDRGRLVTAFLQRFFERYVEYDFTANLENLLDEVSGGRADWKQVLRDFWQHFLPAVAGAKDLSFAQVLEALDEALGKHFFPDDGSGRDPRLCPGCGTGRLSLKLGKFGAFIGCSNYPECRVTRPLAVEPGKSGEAASDADSGPRALGDDPQTGLPVTVRNGPYGPYVQLGGDGGEKPKRVSLPKTLPAQEITLGQAVALLALPREIGRHPESGETIAAGIGRFGPYLKHGKIFKSLTAQDDVLTVGINRAVSLLAEAARPGRAARTALRTIGPHPSDGAPIELYKGRYGPYLAHGGINATLPNGTAPETIDLEAALRLLESRRGKGKPARAAGPAKSPARKSATASPAAKPATATKAASKRPAAKKPATKKPAGKKSSPRRADPAKARARAGE
jgi:DNA topoisomerase-1